MRAKVAVQWHKVPTSVSSTDARSLRSYSFTFEEIRAISNFEAFRADRVDPVVWG